MPSKPIDPTTLPYRDCVGILLLNRDGLVFVGKRRGLSESAWQMPQGGIDKGESPREAAMRELGEEIGTANAEIIEEMADWLYYDLPTDLVGRAFKGKYRGQRQKWFAMRYLGVDGDIDLTAHEVEFDDWRWAPISSLESMVIPFKREVYREIVRRFTPLAGPE